MIVRLTASQACHRLTLREGLKENKKEKRKPGENKNEKTSDCLPSNWDNICIDYPILYAACEYPQHDIDGDDPSWGNGNPWYCECNHMVWEGDSEDAMAGIGVEAVYDENYPLFMWGTWYFEAEHGDGDVDFFWPELFIDPCVNGDDHHYYTYSETPVYGEPDFGGPGYERWYIYFPLGDPDLGPRCYLNLKDSVEGSNEAVFMHPSSPPPWQGSWWWIEAYTQNPPYYPNGNGWSFLTAW